MLLCQWAKVVHSQCQVFKHPMLPSLFGFVTLCVRPQDQEQGNHLLCWLASLGIILLSNFFFPEPRVINKDSLLPPMLLLPVSHPNPQSPLPPPSMVSLLILCQDQYLLTSYLFYYCFWFSVGLIESFSEEIFGFA